MDFKEHRKRLHALEHVQIGRQVMLAEPDYPPAPVIVRVRFMPPVQSAGTPVSPMPQDGARMN